LAIIILHAITDVCTPACLRAASISVEAVTPPTGGMALQRTTSILRAKSGDVKHEAAEQRVSSFVTLVVMFLVELLDV